jgi:hypothetical protein
MAKKKIKKFLKKLAPMAALALGAAALGRRGRNLGVSGANKRAFTTDRAYTGGGYDDPIMTAQDMANDPMFYNASAKKGGRIVKTKGGGKAVRGLGRAFTKGRK